MLEQLMDPKEGEEIAILKTNYGDIKIRLFEEAAPKAVENFKGLIEKGYYNGISFHRVIDNFMIQGGDPTGTGSGGESIWGKPFEDEFHVNYRNIRGALSMANAGPNTNGSQFFIVQMGPVENDIVKQMRSAGEEKGYPDDVVDAYENLGGTYWLDGKHSVFGQVFEGMEVVDEIASVAVDFRDKPTNPVIIEKATIEKY
ncbi:peptidylprolyl isomerase [Anaerosphaera multitolerans]|uniref:Peptidyl-prolyl cis-trans isomerase n=1 Tax=Anaerosphaera multitolerans TaxID=2487351 RepID=A0A437S956_9FIRM|nr:peptidylprolyl isomerase [Anaerosphaera multitolerans]RVU55367.1 peptidylprolyl isomerase [Anaerosphaera multitolerans]